MDAYIPKQKVMTFFGKYAAIKSNDKTQVVMKDPTICGMNKLQIVKLEKAILVFHKGCLQPNGMNTEFINSTIQPPPSLSRFCCKTKKVR